MSGGWCGWQVSSLTLRRRVPAPAPSSCQQAEPGPRRLSPRHESSCCAQARAWKLAWFGSGDSISQSSQCVTLLLLSFPGKLKPWSTMISTINTRMQSTQGPLNSVSARWPFPDAALDLQVQLAYAPSAGLVLAALPTLVAGAQAREGSTSKYSRRGVRPASSSSSLLPHA